MHAYSTTTINPPTVVGYEPDAALDDSTIVNRFRRSTETETEAPLPPDVDHVVIIPRALSSPLVRPLSISHGLSLALYLYLTPSLSPSIYISLPPSLALYLYLTPYISLPIL